MNCFAHYFLFAIYCCQNVIFLSLSEFNSAEMANNLSAAQIFSSESSVHLLSIVMHFY